MQSPAHGLALPHSTPRQGLPNPMTTHTTAGAPGRPAQPDLALSLLIAAAAVLEALALLLRPLLAHAIALMLTIAGWRPARSAAPAQKPAAERANARPASAPAPTSSPSPAPAQRPAAALAARADRRRVHCPRLARWAASPDAELPLWWAV